ncbi:MAG TPA: GspE/PulE family protein, partial [Pelomicrobium sp.]|nr:GspE/PulE family protein [Pelomicrobium sp.]
LSADGLVAREDVDRLLAGGRVGVRSERHPLVVAAEQKWREREPPHRLLTLDRLTEWLADRVGLPYFHIDPLKIDLRAVTGVVSQNYAARYRVLPVEVSGEAITIATAEPYERKWAAELAAMLRKPIRLVVANPVDITRYLAEFYKLAQFIKRAMETQGGDVSAIGNFEQLTQIGSRGPVDHNEQHVVHIVDWLWQYAFEQRASDIHLEPRRELGIVRFRIDGVLHQVYELPGAVMQAVISRIKLLGRMDVVEKRRPQDGRVKTRTPEGVDVELRLSTLPTAFGEKLVMRIFDPEVLVRDLRELGFSEDDRRRWNALTDHPNGIILLTGPTGSGKTTTLYSTLKALATPEVNVSTIEDPIEMVEPAFNQTQVQPGLGLDFAAGVRTLLRQDPDIVMVGEIRDLETAEMAVQAALTGHLELSTLHTNDAPTAVTRLLDLGIAPYLIRSTLLGVLAQRLVRTLCPHCRTPAPLDEAAWQALTAPWKLPTPAHASRADGCLECRMTGYIGRIGIHELVTVTPALRELIDSGCDLPRLREQARRDGMKPLRLAGALKIAAGITTIEEVLKVAPPASESVPATAPVAR